MFSAKYFAICQNMSKHVKILCNMSKHSAICQNILEIWKNIENKMKCIFEFKHGIPDSFLKSKEKIYIWLENHVNINIITFPKKRKWRLY